MSFKMVALSRCKKTGAYVARKGIPADIRDAHERLYGSRWETKFYARAATPIAEAKRRFSEWQAEVATRIATLRSTAHDQGRALTHREAHALAGEWYAWFVAQHEHEPGPADDWDYRLEELSEVRLRYAPATEGLPPEEEAELIDGDPKVQGFVQEAIADRALVSRFLAEKGWPLSPEARRCFLAALVPEYVAGLNLLRRRALGDYSMDRRPSRFPALAPPGASLTCWQLFEAWIKERQPKPATVDRRRAVFLDLLAYFGERGIGTVTDQDAVTWKDRLLTPERSGRTVNDVWLSAAKSVFGWAVTNKMITSNPFKGLRVAYAPPPQNRDSRAFTMTEANIILRASLASPPTRLSAHYKAARRWVPWLCAYTGARVQEMTQLRAEDIEQVDGIWAIRIRPEAGTQKLNKARSVPIHEHLIEQGFIEFARGRSGPLFYSAKAQAAQKPSDPTNPQKALAAKTREHLGTWVRKIGVTDPELSPNHSWRHLFKEIADRCEMREKVSDAITGHAPATIGRSYGRPTLEVMAQELAKFPRVIPGVVHGADDLTEHGQRQAMVLTRPESS